MNDNEKQIRALELMLEAAKLDQQERHRREGGIIGDVVRAPFRIVGGLLDDIFG